MTAYPILYSFRRCPYAMRARWAIKYAGIPVVLREIVLRSKPADMLSISPKGTVPVLLLPDGCVLEQSLDIMLWACSQHDPNGWLAPSRTPTGQMWIASNDGPFKQLLDRYKYADRYPDMPASAYRDHAVDLLLAPMDQQLRTSRYLMGDESSLVDIALLPFVRQFAQVDAPWFEQAPLPALCQWLQTLINTDLFHQVMQKYEPWQPNQPDTLF